MLSKLAHVLYIQKIVVNMHYLCKSGFSYVCTQFVLDASICTLFVLTQVLRHMYTGAILPGKYR